MAAHVNELRACICKRACSFNRAHHVDISAASDMCRLRWRHCLLLLLLLRWGCTASALAVQLRCFLRCSGMLLVPLLQEATAITEAVWCDIENAADMGAVPKFPDLPMNGHHTTQTRCTNLQGQTNHAAAVCLH